MKQIANALNNENQGKRKKNLYIHSVILTIILTDLKLNLPHHTFRSFKENIINRNATNQNYLEVL